MAHRSGPMAKSLPSQAAKAPTEAKEGPRETWRDRVDLDRLRPDDSGRLVQRLADGSTVVTTLDPELQAWATRTMGGYQLPFGAMVLTELSSGRTLVLAGHSSRNETVDTESLTLTPWAPAASVFKLVTASGLLSRGVPPKAMVCYHGGMRGLYKSHIKNNPKLDTTCRSLSFAVAKSVNPIMAKLSLRYLGTSGLEQWSRRYGFNRPIPFDLPVQPSRATIPRDKLELARVSAGFWHTEISPLHGALIAGVAANGGVMRFPHVVDRVIDAGGATHQPRRPGHRRVMDTGSARHLARMMVRTTTMGTARKAFRTRRGRPYLSGVQVGGKTGSLSRKDPFLHYSWFVGFAPLDQPKVAFSVLLGNPAKWRIKANTAGRMLLQQYFAGQKKRQTKQRKVAALVQ